MKLPSEDDIKKCLHLREASKRGAYMSKADQVFVRRIFKRYTEWYVSTEHEVFNATVPFGSNVKMEPLNGPLKP